LRGSDYDPLVPVRNLPCWPSEPLWDQIVPKEVEDLQALGAKYPGLEPL